ncbi:aminomethyltransferase beta-barrel domain-containing protein, partial [Francisella tularensis]|uniref:aminomethyltransferase beta-barrel domain-containing protein n=1 Tax=Francisella tularensis TaxID=263 RepID=UPI002D7F6C08
IMHTDLDTIFIMDFTFLSRQILRQKDQSCEVEVNQDGSVNVTFDQPQRAITPGQSVVFYIDDVCLGGGVII